MALIARELPLAAKPLEIARRLQDQPGFVCLWSAGGGPSYLAVRPIAAARALDPEPGLARCERSSELAQVPRWVGLVPYEARRALERGGHDKDVRSAPHCSDCTWWRYGAVIRVAERVMVVGDDSHAVAELRRLVLRSPARGDAGASLTLLYEEGPAEHRARVQAALDLIKRGEIYQVNLARRLELEVRGHPLELLMRLCRDTRPAFAAALCVDELGVVSTSPELLLHERADGWVMTSPIKGTRPRGRDARSDADLRRELESDEKERAELNMIVDVERNDLGRVARLGSVRVQAPVVTTQGLVWHRRANVLARLLPEVSRTELLEAMLPSGSVTGAPKIRAMEVIAQLEAERRGLYTGGLGFLSHSGLLTLAMAIRTLTVQGDVGHYFTGGGIVADSDPGRELEETRWKARQLFGRAG